VPTSGYGVPPAHPSAHCFGSVACSFNVLVHSPCFLISVVSLQPAAVYSHTSKKKKEKRRSNKQANAVSNQPVNIMEHPSANETFPLRVAGN